MRLRDNYLLNQQKYDELKIKVPQFEQEKIVEETVNNPVWVHFGGGNLFRCFHAEIAQDLINQGELKSGVVVAETYDDEVIEKAYKAYQNRILQVVTKPDGTLEEKLIASIADSYYFSSNNQKDWDAVMEIFTKASLQFVTLSITEKGYNIWGNDGELLSAVKEDIANGPEIPEHNMSALTALLYHRYKDGELPIAMVSTDNFSQNGDRLKKSVVTIAEEWAAKNKVESGFLEYLKNNKKVSFPLTMIDRITPNPAENIAEKLQKQGWEDTEIIHTKKHTNIAPFGNTEETHYLVIEDSFPNGRPDLTKAGVYLVSRETVNDVDEMKVTTCLNPLHTTLAVMGCLLGYTSISDEMKNADLVKLIKYIEYKEGLPVVKNPGIIQPDEFIAEVLEKRLPNPYIPDTPQRIATDTSQKMAIRFGVTIKHYVENPDLTPKQLEYIPFAIAAWCRYLVGINDQGNQFTLSSDPLLGELQKELKKLKLGTVKNAHALLEPILSNESIFGIDLYSVELGTKIEVFFIEMMQHPGSVAEALQKIVEKEEQ